MSRGHARSFCVVSLGCVIGFVFSWYGLLAVLGLWAMWELGMFR
jgi:hypothetical protein